MKNVTLTLTEDELYALGSVLIKWRQDYRLKKDASPEAKEFDKNLSSANNKLWDAIGELTWTEENLLNYILGEEKQSE